MKFSKAFIQSIGILVMLAEQPENHPLKAVVISERLGASHSYLLKICHKLAQAGLIESIASKNGGYQLKKELNSISLLDIYDSVENEHFFDSKQIIVTQMFNNRQMIENSKKVFSKMMYQVEDAFRTQLKNQYLVDLVPRDDQGKLLQIEWAKMNK